jgi:MFS family permease
VLLLLINLFNYIDRQVLAAVEPEIRRALFPESEKPGASDEVVALSKFRMGLLSDAFLITYMLAAPLFGVLAHRFSRWLLICFGVVCWSLASGASGWQWGPLDLPQMLVFSFWMLFLTRCFVGIGEAAYGPIAPAVLSDLYPIERRGKIMSYFYLAIPVGGALGYTLGDMMSHSSLGWRWAFYLVVPPGLLLGLWSFLMWEPNAKEQSTHEEPMRHVTRDDYLQLARTPSFVLNTLGMAAMTFAIGGLAFWMPDYLDWRKQLGEATDLGGVGGRTIFGAVTVLAGLLATLGGGWAGDWLRPRFSGSYFIVSGVAMLLGFPAIVCLTLTPFPAAWIFVFIAVFCLFFNTGPTNTILANVTQPAVRAAAFAVNIFLIHILGDVPSPPLMGYLAGMFGRNVSFLVVSAAALVGGVLWLWGARYLQRDTERAARAAV